MIENEDGTVGGSLDRARVKELHDQASDVEQKAYYRGLLGESDEGKAIDGPPSEAEPAAEAAESPEPEPEVEVEAEEIDPEATDAVEPMSELDKLREEAEALGIKVDGRWGEERLRDEIAAYDAAEGEE